MNVRPNEWYIFRPLAAVVRGWSSQGHAQRTLLKLLPLLNQDLCVCRRNKGCIKREVTMARRESEKGAYIAGELEKPNVAEEHLCISCFRDGLAGKSRRRQRRLLCEQLPFVLRLSDRHRDRRHHGILRTSNFKTRMVPHSLGALIRASPAADNSVLLDGPVFLFLYCLESVRILSHGPVVTVTKQTGGTSFAISLYRLGPYLVAMWSRSTG